MASQVLYRTVNRTWVLMALGYHIPASLSSVPNIKVSTRVSIPRYTIKFLYVKSKNTYMSGYTHKGPLGGNRKYAAYEYRMKNFTKI